jgi:hypothetical protein
MASSDVVLTKGFDLFISLKALMKEAPDKLNAGRSELEREMMMFSKINSGLNGISGKGLGRFLARRETKSRKHTFVTDALVV